MSSVPHHTPTVACRSSPPCNPNRTSPSEQPSKPRPPGGSRGTSSSNGGVGMFSVGPRCAGPDAAWRQDEGAGVTSSGVVGAAGAGVGLRGADGALPSGHVEQSGARERADRKYDPVTIAVMRAISVVMTDLLARNHRPTPDPNGLLGLAGRLPGPGQRTPARTRSRSRRILASR
jgi:hypothetical protein